MTNTDIYICINYDSEGEIAHLELLSEPPKFEGFDELRVACINGGDSLQLERRV